MNLVIILGLAGRFFPTNIRILTKIEIFLEEKPTKNRSKFSQKIIFSSKTEISE